MEGGRPSSYFLDDDIAYLFEQTDGIVNQKIPRMYHRRYYGGVTKNLFVRIFFLPTTEVSRLN